MNVEDHVLMAFSDDIADRISKKTIAALQKTTDTLSGEDSELINVWDEICSQVQFENSTYWDAYQNTTTSIVLGYVGKLKKHEKMVVWFQTEEGMGWLCDDENVDKKDPPMSDDDIAEYIVREYVFKVAGTWSNKRIRAFIDRSQRTD
jgi:hypothetical protein